MVTVLAGCASSPDLTPPAGPAARSSRYRASDGPGDAERRREFLAGTSAADAPALIAANNPAHTDAVAEFFSDPRKPYAARLAALSALRSLRELDPGEYARVFPHVRAKLWEEVSHGNGLVMSPENEKGFIEAIGWLSDEKDPQVNVTLEFHLDRATVRRKRLSDAALCAVALGLASYPKSDGAKETLWAALKDAREAGVVRSCCLRALKVFHPKDLEALVIGLTPAPGDDWLIDLQRRLR